VTGLLERMARAWTDEAEKTSIGRMRWVFADVPRRVEALSNGTREPDGPEDAAAIAVLREEQAPAGSAEQWAIYEGAPPPPCAMCDGATWIKTVDYTDAGVTPRTDPCPDCARGAR